jgi:hypothetical protein
MDAIFFQPRICIRLRDEAGLFNKSKCSRTIFKEGILLSFDFKNGSKCLVLKNNSDAVDF